MNRFPQMPNNQQVIQGFLNGLQVFANNPMQYLSGIPQEYAKDPNEAIQYLMDSGKINQQQYMQAKRTADQMKNNPLFQQMFQQMFKK